MSLDPWVSRPLAPTGSVGFTPTGTLSPISRWALGSYPVGFTPPSICQPDPLTSDHLQPVLLNPLGFPGFSTSGSPGALSSLPRLGLWSNPLISIITGPKGSSPRPSANRTQLDARTLWPTSTCPDTPLGVPLILDSRPRPPANMTHWLASPHPLMQSITGPGGPIPRLRPRPSAKQTH